MANALNKKQIAMAKKETVKTIQSYKSSANGLMKEFRTVSGYVLTAHRGYVNAGIQNERKPSVKSEKKVARAYDSLVYAASTYKRMTIKLAAIQDNIESEYAKLIGLYRMQGDFNGAERVGSEYDSYCDSYANLLKRNDRSGGNADIVPVSELDLEEEQPEDDFADYEEYLEEPVAEEPVNEEPQPEPEPESAPAPQPDSRYESVRPVALPPYVNSVIAQPVCPGVYPMSQPMCTNMRPMMNDWCMPQQPQPQQAPAVSSVNVAPVTIDVTPIIDKAINSAIDRLSESLNRKIDAYVKNLVLPTPPAPAPAPAPAPVVVEVPVAAPAKDNSAEVEMLENVLAEENNILDKIKELFTSISDMIVALGDASAQSMNISLKQKELAELQKQINDIQRHNVREQKGVQVHQRLVSEEQIELIAAQTLVVESQQTLAERQNAVAEAQNAAVIAEGEIIEIMNALSDNNAQISEKQQQLLAGSEKQNAVLEQLVVRNREILQDQRAALAVSKKLAKDQRQLAEKNGLKAKSEKKEQLAEEAAPAPEVEATVTENAEVNEA